MIRHEQMQAMLACPGDLSPAERGRLQGHLAGCPDCRGLAALYEENRTRLRSLAQTRPPEEIRRSVVSAAESTQGALVAFGPVVFAFLIIPVTLLGLGAVAEFGARGLAGDLVVFCLFCGLTAWRVRRLEGAMEMPTVRERWNPLGDLGRLGIDLAGMVAGLALFGLVLWAISLLGGH